MKKHVKIKARRMPTGPDRDHIVLLWLQIDPKACRKSAERYMGEKLSDFDWRYYVEFIVASSRSLSN